jgi:hypothetical protein
MNRRPRLYGSGPAKRMGVIRRLRTLLEGSAETLPRAMEPPTRRHGKTTENARDLGGGESLPLRQKKHLPVARGQTAKRLVHQSLLAVG